MSYNFFRDARSISNSFLCRYDNTNGYATDFSTNGDVDGWDLYNNIYLYGCWEGMLFGTSYDRECYVGRTNPFAYIEAETYYLIRVMMKITSNEDVKPGPTKGKIRWVRYGDVVWNTAKEYEFDIVVDDSWHLYEIDMSPAQWWQGNINNIRVYPFIDGWAGDQFAIKYIQIGSLDTWSCLNTQCAYYANYSHPCPGAGSRGSCRAGESKSRYTTISGVNDELIVNINDYGDLRFNLGTNINVSGPDMARIINQQLSTFNVGGYAYSTVEYTAIDNKLNILSGTTGDSSSVVVVNTSAAQELGFYDSLGNDISSNEVGTESSDGFDYASSRLLTALEISRLIDGNIDVPAYTHNPTQYAVEGGRRDFFFVGEGATHMAFDEFSNIGKTLIDISHPFDNNGRIKSIYVYGKINEGTTPKIKIVRPKQDGTMSVVHSFDMPVYDSSYMYTTKPVVYRKDCDVMVQKGDYIAVYNMNVYVGQTFTGNPDATFFSIDGEVNGVFELNDVCSYGLGGFPIYARGERRQLNTLIDIDMGERVNIEEVVFYGKEYTGIVDFNIASCLDVSWNVNLFNGVHKHRGQYLSNSDPWEETHQNIAVGNECLDDCVLTADNGKAGDSLESLTGEHSYFYVTGDAEWGYKSVCDGTTEFCGNMLLENTWSYQRDPIEFTLNFPYGFKTKVYKSSMYFKESNNFKNFSLSTYRGPSDTLGTADIPSYDYVSAYTAVSIDGIRYTEENNTSVSGYLFKNPCSSDPIVSGYTVVNEAEYAAAIKAGRWNILTHEFAPVECAGFRIYCNNHFSTKITELEVYSSFDITPSLADNVLMTYSVYGDLWTTLYFEENGADKITAFVGDSPRYFRLELNSQTCFQLNGMEASVGSQVKTEECEPFVLLEHAKINSVNEAYPIEVKNVYDVPLDLAVDIPGDVYSTDNLVFWSKAGSENELINPEVGPLAIIRKREPYTIFNDNQQCAINVPSYGLKNMVHGKNAYTQINEAGWQSYGTLSSGVSIDFSNNKDGKKTLLGFSPVSSKFWKITTGLSTVNSAILGVTAKNSGTVIPINKVYYSVSSGAAGGSYYSYLNSDNSLSSNEEINYLFGSGNFTAYFNVVAGDSLNTVIEVSDGLYADYIFADSYVYLDYNFIGDVVSFDFECVFKRTNVWDDAYALDFNFVDSGNNSKVRYTIGERGGSWYGRIYSDGIYQTNIITTLSDREYKVIMKRRNTAWTIQIQDLSDSSFIVDWSGTLSNNAVSKLRLGLLNYDITDAGHHFPPVLNNTTTKIKSVKIESVPYFSVVEGLIIELYNSQPLDEIVLYLHSSVVPGKLMLGISTTNGAFYGYASEDGLSSYTTLITDNFTGTVLDTSVWDTFIAPNASVTVSGSLELNNISGGGYSGACCYTANSFSTENSIRIRCRWWPHNDHNVNYAMPGIRIFGTGSSRDGAYGCINQHCVYLSLGYYTNTTNRTGLYVYEVEEGPSWTGTQIGNVSINIDEMDWHDLDIIFNFSNRTFYVDLDNGDYMLSCVVSQSVIDSMGDTFQVEFCSCDAIKDNTEKFDDIFIGQSTSSTLLTVTEENYYIYFAIDLENRHDIGIIRNYGAATDKLLLSLNNNTDFSNSFVDDPNSVNWNNSTYNDSRWVRIPLLCGDGTNRYIRKLGIYPDIGTSVCYNGGYNCDWCSIGNLLTRYDIGINVASGILSYSNYYASYFPTFAIDGLYSDDGADLYWAFYENDSTDPFIEIDLGNLYYIGEVCLYHGVAVGNSVGLITSYTISASTTASGSNFVDIFTVTGNTAYERHHYTNLPTQARRIKFTVDAFTADPVFIYNESTSAYTRYNVGYLREIQIYTAKSVDYIDSEVWPVVCINLQDGFWVKGHSLFNKDVSDNITDWDNSEEFFKYADSPRNDPHKVAFYEQGEYFNVYSSSDSSGDVQGDWEYIIENEVYLHEGQCIVQWEAYHVNVENEISVRFEGNVVVDGFATTLSTSWALQENTVVISESGFYNIKGVQHIDNSYNWGIRNVKIYKTSDHCRWVAVTRDTAENYSYDDDTNKYGKDYLSRIEVYSTDLLRPTEYYWWWTSVISTLSNDYLYTKEGKRSLKIEYPTSSGIDTVRFIEGDNFGIDEHWSIKDCFTCQLYISDVNCIDQNYGYIVFGVVESSMPVYYLWDIKNITFSNGWNKLCLCFEDASVVGNEEFNVATNTLSDKLDFKHNGEPFSSFFIQYRGIGQAFVMYLDAIKIERASFEEVNFGNGLCLFDNDLLEVPITGMSLEKGTIEFWYKFYTDTQGYDIFNKSYTRTLFTITNNNNDFLSVVIAEYKWFQVLLGNLRDVVTLTKEQDQIATKHLFNIGDVVHIAVVWDNTGSFIDNNETLRFYINGEKIIGYNETWVVDDTKSFFLKFGGALSQINAFITNYNGCGTIDNLKLYNYCKDSFNIDSEGDKTELIISPNNFIEVSENNIDFYGIGSSSLPIVFKNVLVDETKIIYVRANKSENFKNSIKKTADLMIEWVSIV